MRTLERTVEAARRESAAALAKARADKERLVGYPLAYQPMVYKMLADPTQAAFFEYLQQMFDDGKHPHEMNR